MKRDPFVARLVAMFEQGRFAELERSARECTRRFPRDGFGWQALGVAIKAMGRPAQEALPPLREAVARMPGDAEAHANLGLVLMETGHLEEGEAVCRRALALQPGHVEACNHLGMILQLRGRHAEAEGCFRAILAARPDSLDALRNLGLLVNKLGRLEEAEACYRRVLASRPEDVDLLCDLGYLFLTQGRMGEGWPLHELRYHPRRAHGERIVGETRYPMWQGEALAGKSLLVLPEQGYGDQIQFVRFLPLLRASGVAKVTLVVFSPLAALFASLEGVDRVVSVGEPDGGERFDCWTFLLSLPMRLGLDLATLPARLPYLHAPRERIAFWADRLPAGGFRVGVQWLGSARHSNDGQRSLSGLGALRPLWSVPGITWVGLQKERGEEETRHPPPGQPLHDPGEAWRDFADTAAIVAQLDLVITVDTALAHLAGALGKACWVLLPAYDTDWRWMRDRDDSPWYPGIMRLFRQERAGEWQPVVQRVREALRGMVGEGS
ncbi:MAG: glycosyltransferase family protein [Magnetococcales bacterium]|nr:glycosyltransferase family protein [Magnetococcales bacterium]